eukprot:2886486-Amphidinium_carterae.2
MPTLAHITVAASNRPPRSAQLHQAPPRKEEYPKQAMSSSNIDVVPPELLLFCPDLQALVLF